MVTPRMSTVGNSTAFGSSVKGGGFGPPRVSVDLGRGDRGDAMSARSNKPAGGGHGGGVAGMTESQRAKIETKKAEDKAATSEKAASQIAADPKKWLQNELRSALEHQRLSNEVAVEIEKRRQASIQLQALEVRSAEGEAALSERRGGDGDAPMDMTDGEQQAAAVASALATEIEALKVKVAHHSAQVQTLQSKLLVASRGESSHDTVSFKLDALTRVDHARNLLKSAVPQLVQRELQLKVAHGD